MYREINKDIREYKAKLFGTFSFRETVGILLLIVGVYLMYMLCHLLFPFASIDSFIMICFFAIGALPGIFIGFIRPYGLDFEKYISTVYVERYVKPQVLIFQNDIILDEETEKTSAKGPFSTVECPAYK